MPDPPYRLFEVTGIELEYAIVDRETLAVRPLADAVLAAVNGGQPVGEVERGPVAWSNELALHVIELKTNGPVATLEGVEEDLQREVEAVNEILAPHGAALMPTAMHPNMDPDRDLQLWPHDNDTIYQAFHRIFDCRGHGWANLQSCHINLPFAGDEEMGRLHAAIRMVLPLLPALAASSPIADGRRQPFADYRLEVYRHNARRVPSVSGAVIPEPVFTRREYEEVLLAGIYRDLAPLDPEGVLRHEWVNARGCIVRFDRDAIEIRIQDVQEHPAADLAVAAAVRRVLQELVAEGPSSYAHQRTWETERLRAIFDATVRAGCEARVEDGDYLAALGLGRTPRWARDVWGALLADAPPPALGLILERGCLSRRILRALGDPPVGSEVPADRLAPVYDALRGCLAEGRPFVPEK